MTIVRLGATVVSSSPAARQFFFIFLFYVIIFSLYFYIYIKIYIYIIFILYIEEERKKYIYFKRFEGEANEYKTDNRTTLLQDMIQLDRVSPSTYREFTLGEKNK